MRFREVFRYELEYHVRNSVTWVYAALLFGLAVLLTAADAASEVTVRRNAPQQIAEFMLVQGMLGVLICAGLFGDAAVRDAQAGMDALLYTSPLRKLEYLGGRFLAALTTNAVILLTVPLGLAAGTLAPFEPGTFLPFRAIAYVQPFVLFLLPNLIFIAALLFTTGVLARQVIPVYVVAICIFTAFVFAQVVLEGINNPTVSILVDPLGVGAVDGIVRYWTVAERNTRLIGFPAGLLFNRAAWLAIAAVVLIMLQRRFRFAHPDESGRSRGTREPAGEVETAPVRAVEVPRVAGSFGFRTLVRQTVAVARNSLSEVLRRRTFVAVLVVGVGLSLLMLADESSTWPLTILVLERMLIGLVTPVAYLLMSVYAGELVWKDREVRVADIADATSVPDSVALLGRFLALIAVLAVYQTTTMIAGILFQAVQGYYRFEVDLYIRVLHGLNLIDLALFAALAMTIHVIINHKYLAHIIVVLACLAPYVAQQFGLIRHHLLLYGTDPGWTYSDMNGFGPFIGPFLWFKLYWGAWALLIALVGVALWVRGAESGMRRRLGLGRARLTGPVARAAGVAIALIGVLGGVIFYNTNILNDYLSSDEQGATQAQYEKRYARYENVAQPSLMAAELRIEIYPDQQAVDLRGSYRLLNQRDVAIDSVHVVVHPAIDVRSLSFDRAFNPVLVDEQLGYRTFALAQPLAPGDSMQLEFDVGFRQRGFANGGLQTDVVANGAYFNRMWLPFIGYQGLFELPDGKARERFGLAPQPPLPGPGDVAARAARGNEDHVRIVAIIGTAAHQAAIMPGVLRRTWTENGRRYFHYELERPGEFSATVFSGQWEVREGRWRGLPLRVFHHPTHTHNVDRMLESMKASLEYYTTHFGPYPESHLRTIEIPRYGRFGRAHVNTTAFTEDGFLFRHQEGEMDLTFHGNAHEVAHQWWGGMVKGAAARGHGFLSEALANYSAMMVTERTYGVEAVRRTHEFQLERYLLRRADFPDVPLLEVSDQPHIAYGKGSAALYILRSHIGEDAMNTALRRYFTKFATGPNRLHPTSLDLFAELRAVTPESLRYLLTDLFETVTLWDVRTTQAIVEPAADGAYVVTMDVLAKKVRTDSVGNQVEVPMNDLVDIVVYATRSGKDKVGEVLHLQRHRIRTGTQTIRIRVPREPARAGIDPYRMLIDRNEDNNVIDVKAPATHPVRTR